MCNINVLLRTQTVSGVDPCHITLDMDPDQLFHFKGLDSYGIYLKRQSHKKFII